MLTMPISTANADHYSWGGQCDGWHLVRAQGLSVIEERMPPGTAEVKHWHTRARQFFYVVSGTLVMDVEGVEPMTSVTPMVMKKRQDAVTLADVET